MTVKTLETRDLQPRIATEIRSDKQTLLSGEHAGEIRDLLEQRGVLVIPQINFTDEEQVAFTETLGTLATESRGQRVYNVTLDTSVNKFADYLKGSLYWHLDGTMNEVPIFASLLASKVLPKTGGGDTEFCNTYAAYEDLPEDEKDELASLRVMHSTWNTLLYYEPEPDIRDAAADDGDRGAGAAARLESPLRAQVAGSRVHREPHRRHGPGEEHRNPGAAA